MTFSEKTNDLILEINSKGKLKNIFELSFLIEETYSKGNEKAFQDIIFAARYVYGLFSVIKANFNTDLVNDSIKDEYSGALISLKNGIKAVTDMTDMKNHFESKFYGLSQDCIMNFMVLVEDLSICKNYFNDKKFN